jgi:hypothetical protein
VSPKDEQQPRADADDPAMAAWEVLVAREEVVYLKAVLEAYPGLAAVQAERGRQSSDRVPLTLVTTVELADELGQVLRELAEEIPVTVLAAPSPATRTTCERGT